MRSRFTFPFRRPTPSRLTVRRHAAPMLAAAVLAGAPPGAAAQGVSDGERARASQMLDLLKEQLRKHYYDSTFGGRDLDRLGYQAQRWIDTATSTPSLLGALAQFMQELHDSHTRFIPPALTTQVDYGFEWRAIGDDCFVSEVRKGSDAQAQGLQVGDKLLAMDGIRPTRDNAGTLYYVYYSLSPRAGMRVLAEAPDGAKRSLMLEAKVTRRLARLDLNDLEQWRYFRDFIAGSGRLEHRFVTRDSVALWTFTNFGYKDGRLDRYMGDARKYPWLILDLRGNGGGAVEGITRLLGHFFDKPFEVMEQQFRDSTVKHTVEPRGRDGPYAGQIIVLTDAESASASEVTARVLQQHRGATVVGDRTMGAVVASRVHGMTAGGGGMVVPFWATISGYAIRMTDGKELEGVGVMPNVAALPTGRDLAAGTDPVMQFALELAGVKVTAAEAALIWKK